MIIKLLTIIIFLFCVSNIMFGQYENSCEKWRDLLMFGKGKDSNILSQNRIMELENAINCLIAYERNFDINEHWIECTNDSECDEIYASMSSNFDNYFHHGSNQFTAMYLISAVYFGDFEFTKRIEVIAYNSSREDPFTDLTKVVNPSFIQKLFLPKIRNRKTCYRVEKKVSNLLFALYEKWVGEMNRNGLEYMRDNNLNPLKDTSYYWNSVLE